MSEKEKGEAAEEEERGPVHEKKEWQGKIRKDGRVGERSKAGHKLVELCAKFVI